MKQKKMLSLLLAVSATLMSGLSLTAFAQEENPFVLEDPYMIEYSVGERGLNFSSEQAIQQVEKAFAGLDPTPIGQDTVGGAGRPLSGNLAGFNAGSVYLSGRQAADLPE